MDFKTTNTKGKFLSDAVSCIRKFSGETVVIKYGGSGLVDMERIKTLAHDLVLLKSCGIDVILVHGAGENTYKIFDGSNIKIDFEEGCAVTTKDNLELTEMLLSGHINKKLVLEICKAGGVALGFSGKDASMITAKKMRKTKRETDSNIEKIVDFGYLGVPFKINTEIFEIMNESPVIPVISPVGFDSHYNTYIMNADDVASAIASTLNANRLILITESGGLKDESGNLIKAMTKCEATTFKKSKVLNKFILQKLDTCLCALQNGVYATHLISAHQEHGVLLEMLTKDRSGTMIYNTDNVFNSENIDFDDYE
jgi:acetylglutamate kinase